MPILVCSRICSLLLVRSELLQLVKRHLAQSLLVRSVQEDLRDNLLAQRVVLVRIKSLPPSGKSKISLPYNMHSRSMSELTC